MTGPLHTYKKLFGILYMPWMVIRMSPQPVWSPPGPWLCLTSGASNHMVMLGYDWGLLSISYTYQIHFIHIKLVWHTLYDVDGH